MAELDAKDPILSSRDDKNRSKKAEFYFSNDILSEFVMRFAARALICCAVARQSGE